VSTRAAYSTRSDAGLQIEVRDFLIAQSDAPVEVPLISKSAALVEVREGSGVAIVGGSTAQLAPGFVFTVSEGTPLRVQAKGEPLSFRVHLYRQQ
jgi:mannose-6-phosphate isomerase class I